MAVSSTARSNRRQGVRLERLAWPALIAGLVVAGLLLAWADSSIFHAAFPTFPEPPVRGGRGLGQVAPNVDQIPRVRVGPKIAFVLGTRGLFQFGWFVSVALALILLTGLALALFPNRVRVAVERMEVPSALATALTAGVASGLLLAAATFLLRNSFVFLAMVPVVWGLTALCFVFGLSALALALGRRLSRRLGAVHPLVTALAGILIICDAALVPYAGWVLLACVALAGLGLAVVTRFGSDSGWSLEELTW